MSQPLALAAALPVAPPVAAHDWATFGGQLEVFVQHVLRLLPLDVRARAACVCRGWNAATADPALWHTLWFDDSSKLTLSDATLARLCARAGAVLRELRLDAPALGVPAAGLVAALHAGGCAGLQRLKLRKTDVALNCMKALSAEQAQQLAAACPALEHTACAVSCERPEDLANACALLPGPLTLQAYDREVSLHALHTVHQLPANVVELALRPVLLGPAGSIALGDVLRVNTAITSLWLSNNSIGAEADFLFEALNANHTLTTLYVDGNGIDDASAAELGATLETNATLTMLDLSFNCIGPEGAEALGRGMRTNAGIRTLLLNSNSIGVAGAKALGEALRTNQTLTTLDLGENGIGDEGAAALCDALTTNASLTMLELYTNGVGDHGAASLGEAVRRNATLKVLSLASGTLGMSASHEFGVTFTVVNLS